MTNTKQQNINELRAVARILHNVFFSEPSSNNLQIFEQIISTDQWPQLLNCEEELQGLALLKMWFKYPESQKALKLEFGRLFHGPRMPEAPPWGSFYTDEQQLLNGDSAQKLMHFFKISGISFQLECNQPLDHVGLIFAAIEVLMARIAEDEDNLTLNEQVRTLLEVYSLPWIFIFLNLVIEKSNTGFYRGFAYLSKSYIKSLSSFLSDTPTCK